MRKKIVLTGGHLAPAVAVIEELQKRKGWEIYFLGRKHAFSAKEFISLEYQTMKKMNIPFYDLQASRSVIKFPLSLIKSLKLLKKLKVDIILSFGGYLALPVCLAGWWLKIPVLTHEQTLKPGLANKIIALFAKKVLLGWREAVEGFWGFRERKTTWTGNPVRREILNNLTMKQFNNLPRRQAGETIKENFPLIYITGGSTGAHSINKVVMEILPQLLKSYRVIHQSGESEYKDYEKLTAYSLRLTVELRKRYSLRKYIESEEAGKIMREADIIVGRAGANTITEIALLGKPVILIPLPWAAYGEQLANAKKLASQSGVVILPQENLTGRSLYRCLNALRQNLKEYGKKAKEFSQTSEIKKHLQAASAVVDIIERFIDRRTRSFEGRKKSRIREN